ncbi:methyltransferase domain-containing protein [Salinibaculum salinum]|uniref:methyltransferase domain-containing protein n=1 Tax=Salinibaculum salinum TaxID=3131996 RepID=UPI0030EF1348
MHDERPTADDDFRTGSIARVERSKRDAMSWYDRLSPWYDTLVARLDRRPRNRGIELLDVQNGQRVLDVGAGTGQALVSFADDVGATGHVVGLDISEGMCSVARETVAAAHVGNRVAVVRGDAEELPFRSATFDATFASFTLELFDTPVLPAVLEEWHRVLRDDGRLGVVALSKRDAGAVTHAYERFHDLFPQYADCRPIYVNELLEATGFTVVEMESTSLWGLTVEVVVARPTG